MFNTSWAVGQNVSAVDDSSVVVLIALIISEPLEHVKLMQNCVHVISVFRVGSVVLIKLDSCSECFISLRNFTEGKLRLEKSFVYSRKSVVESDTCLAI